MKDYKIIIAVKNNLILQRIVNLGYKNVSDFCRKNNLYTEQVGELINMKVSPLNKLTGEWRKSAIKVAEALFCFPEDLFSKTQRELELKRNTAEAFFNESDLKNFIEAPEEVVSQIELKGKIDEVVKILHDREQYVITCRYGLHGQEIKSYKELSEELGVAPQGVVFIEKVALKKLRKPSASKTIRGLL
jgi:RNA polymerase sigma factor (sigma-70 family)